MQILSGAAAFSALLTLAAPARAVECPDGLGVYQGTVTPTHELLFAGTDHGTMTLSKGKARATYPFTITYSNGIARAYLTVTGKNAPSSLVMEFGPDFKPSKVKGAAPFIVTPELASAFYYWDEFRSRQNNDLLPNEAWRLVRCTSAS